MPGITVRVILVIFEPSGDPNITLSRVPIFALAVEEVKEGQMRSHKVRWDQLRSNFWNSGKDEFEVPELFRSDNFTQKELYPDTTLT